MTWDEQTESLQEYLSSEECQRDEEEFAAWNDMQMEAIALISACGCKEYAFKYAAITGMFELASVIANMAGLSTDPQFIESCSNNAIRYGVCDNDSVEAWCQDIFIA